MNKKKLSNRLAEKILLKAGGIKYPLSFCRGFRGTDTKILQINDKLSLYLERDEVLNNRQSNLERTNPTYYIVGDYHLNGRDVREYLASFCTK